MNVLYKLSGKCFTHVKSLFSFFCGFFYCNRVICLCLIFIIKDVKRGAFLFWFFDLIESFMIKIVFWTDERILNFFLEIFFKLCRWYSSKFGVHMFDRFEFDDIKVTFASFVDFIGDEMLLYLRYCQCWHFK